MEQEKDKDYIKGMNWLMNKYEKSSDRYIADEKFIMEYIKLPFWKHVLFGKSMIKKHLEKMLKEYEF